MLCEEKLPDADIYQLQISSLKQRAICIRG